MIKLLVIADDFTGALDTGVQFAEKGAATRVITDAEYDFVSVEEDVQVLVMGLETRHRDSDDAYEMVYGVVKRAKEAGIPYIYKKTDSALRGNIGSELTALLEASGKQKLTFLPAYPKMNRITRNGIHYIDDIPVGQSIFGNDNLNPVMESEVRKLIGLQSDVPVYLSHEDNNKDAAGIAVYDGETDQQIQEIARDLYQKDQLSIMAGCAGFASVLPEILGLAGSQKDKIRFNKPFFIICGSVNLITRKQLDYAEKNDYQRIHLTPEQRINAEVWDLQSDFLTQIIERSQKFPGVIIDTLETPQEENTFVYASKNGIDAETVPVKIADSLGTLTCKLLDGGLESQLIIIGGDTLLAFIKLAGITEMIPMYELAPGVVLSHYVMNGKHYELISKSGGFGEETLFTDLGYGHKSEKGA